MGHRMWEVDKKGSALVFLDKIHGALGKDRGKLCLVFCCYRRVDDFFIFKQRQVREVVRQLGMKRPHVIGIGNPVELVEAMTGRKKLFLKAKMPFTVNGSGIAFLFKDFGYGFFLIRNPYFRSMA